MVELARVNSYSFVEPTDSWRLFITIIGSVEKSVYTFEGVRSTTLANPLRIFSVYFLFRISLLFYWVIEFLIDISLLSLRRVLLFFLFLNCVL